MWNPKLYIQLHRVHHAAGTQGPDFQPYLLLDSFGNTMAISAKTSGHFTKDIESLMGLLQLIGLWFYIVSVHCWQKNESLPFFRNYKYTFKES